MKKTLGHVTCEARSSRQARVCALGLTFSSPTSCPVPSALCPRRHGGHQARLPKKSGTANQASISAKQAKSSRGHHETLAKDLAHNEKEGPTSTSRARDEIPIPPSAMWPLIGGILHCWRG
jgi:hypothetical protein